MNCVPDEFRDALSLLMPDADVAPSPGETVFFPCHHPDALEFGNRLFFLEQGAMPRLDYELEVRIPPGALRARGTWHGAEPPGGVPVPAQRMWVADDRAFEVVGEIRRPADRADE